MTTPALELAHVGRVHPGGQRALDGIDLTVAEGELVTVVGPSGCGKSTLLRVVAGLDAASEGRVLIGGRDMTDVDPRRRDVAMVFQSYALYPHRTVRRNLAFPLEMRGLGRSEVARRVADTAAGLALTPLLDRRPRQLSGGERQRVALGRALIREPRVFLLDEPLSNLDALLRVETRGEIVRLHRRTGRAMLYVTHDQEEAMSLGDRVAVLRAGRLEQVGPPAEVYGRPATSWVGTFFGAPAMRLVRGRLSAADGGVRFTGGGLSIAAPIPWSGPVPGAPVDLGLRPESIGPATGGRSDGQGRIERVEMLGAVQVVHVTTSAEGPSVQLALRCDPRLRFSVGAPIALTVDAASVHVFDPRDGRRLSP